jgi:hypothetical protein
MWDAIIVDGRVYQAAALPALVVPVMGFPFWLPSRIIPAAFGWRGGR